MSKTMNATAESLYLGVAAFRKELDNPEYLTGDRLEHVKEHWNATVGGKTPLATDFGNPPIGNLTTLFESVEGLWEAPQRLGYVTNELLAIERRNAKLRATGQHRHPESKRSEMSHLTSYVNSFLSTNPNPRVNARALGAIKGLSKGGLPLPPELNREVVGFLSPAGEPEELEKALSRSSKYYRGKPGVYAPPPGGYGPGAAGGPGGPPAGGKRRKTRKGNGKGKSRSRRNRYSRRR